MFSRVVSLLLHVFQTASYRSSHFSIGGSEGFVEVVDLLDDLVLDVTTTRNEIMETLLLATAQSSAATLVSFEVSSIDS